MDLGLKGKKALITGASKGLGAEIAKTLAAEGCNLFLVALDAERLEDLKGEIQSEYNGVTVEVLELDMRVSVACDRISRAAGEVDILINNAGDVPGGSILDIDEAQWRRAWDLKIFGYINLCREFYAKMTAARHGVIINIVGTTGERPRADHIAVSSGNAALLALSRALGSESVKFGTRVVAINPGPSETDRQVVRWEARAQEKFGDPSRWRELVTDYPFGRLAKPEEIAAVVTFMASERASYVSGVSVSVDGGSQR
jgi:3-oxoacyl-[acyl-carrier protein] reductase